MSQIYYAEQIRVMPQLQKYTNEIEDDSAGDCKTLDYFVHISVWKLCVTLRTQTQLEQRLYLEKSCVTTNYYTI